ncbi:MAG TPA: phage tail sheath subtilisin-like domain-containing protein, partial [Acidobacteriota bacterium]|nr:phage tail sheath subtilisin-like domain-containing protein [Acidobacteriota bacterium]
MTKIDGVTTTTAAFIGKTEQGPTIPQVVSSWIEFQNTFGAFTSDSFLPHAVNGFFINGGQRCFIARTIEASDYESQLDALKAIDEISIVNIPNAASDIAKVLIAQCETLKNRFAIVDSERGSDFRSLNPRNHFGSSRFAALYYPWIRITDPLTGNPKIVPPGGFVAGIYVRNDLQYGVHKAPANQVVQGALDLASQLNQDDEKILTSQGVNAIRKFPERGILVWGARTLSTESELNYVNVRRLFSYIEQS